MSNSNDSSIINLPDSSQEKLKNAIPSEINKKENSPSFKFIDKVRAKLLTEYEIIKKLREITSDYDIELLTALLSDVNSYIELHKAYLISSFYHSDIQEEILKWQRNGRKIPFLNPDVSENEPINKKDLDLEKLMFADEFTSIYKLIAFIEDKIDSSSRTIIKDNEKLSEPPVESSSPPNSSNKEVKSLKWHSVDYSKLDQIYKALKENDYLNCGLKKFKDLFYKNDAEPVKWEGSNTSLIYFFDRLICKEKISVAQKTKWKTLRAKFIYGSCKEAQILSPIKHGFKDFKDKDFFDNLIK